MGVADLRTPFYGVPKTDTSWLGKLVSTAGDAIDNKVAGDLIQKSLSQGQIQAGVAPGSPSVPTTTQQSTRAAPVMPVTRGEPQGSTYRPFIDTVQKGGRLPDGRQIPGITNPYGLSAVAAYGKAESSWSGDKANATWADPSESGQAGTSGGAMSWRGPRLGALQNYAKSKGEQGNGSPQTQAEFFLQENPQVTQALNNAKSPQEANSILANAWKFAGYDRPGGENGRRAAMTQNYYAQEFSKMPNAGAAAIEAVAPQGGFDSGRFAPTNDVAQGDLGMRQGLYRQTNEMQSAPYVDPEVSAQPQAAPAPLPYSQAPTNSPAPVSPQAAQTSNQLIAAGAVPLNRQNTDPDLIRRMVQNPVTRPLGLQMAQQVLGSGKSQEPWQFVQLPNGDFARANQQTGAVERIGNYAKPQDPIKVSDGDTLLDPITKQPLYVGKPKTPQSFQEYQLAKQSGFAGTYADWEKVKVPGVTVNNQPGEGSAAKAAGEGLGKLFSGIFDAGMSANEDKASIGLLRSSLANSPNGVVGGLASIASDYGVNLGPGADQVQVAKAVIAKMVPAQRVPGSGTTSDRDLAQFQAALPRLSGTAKGNQILLDTLDALADHKARQADIVAGFYSGDKTQAQVVKELRALPDPYTAYKKFANQNGGDAAGGISSPKTDAEFNALPSGTIYIDPDDNKQYRKP